MALGMDKHTGRWITGIDHLQQSIVDILSTRIGTRVERRDYGSRLPELVDDNIDQRFRVEAYAAVAGAIRQWEPRVTPERVQLMSVASDGPVFELEFVRVADGARASLRVTLSGTASAVVTPETLTHVIGSEYTLESVTTGVRPEYGRVGYE